MYQVLRARAALKNGGNDAIVYAKRHLWCVFSTGGDHAAQGDAPARPAWVLGAIRVAPAHAQSTMQIAPGSLCCNGCSKA